MNFGSKRLRPFLAVVLTLIGLVALLAGCKEADPTAEPSGHDRATPGSVAQEAPTPSNPCPMGPLFSMAPIDLDQITSMSVLGSLIPPGHTFPTPHLYMFVRNLDTADDIPVTIYAPADMMVTTVIFKYQDRSGILTDYTDYDVHFSVCDQVQLYFIHVRSLTHPAIVEAMAEGDCPVSGAERGYRECHLRVEIPVRAGEVLGTTGDRDAGITGLDVGLRDYRLPHGRSAFANPERWCDEEHPHIVQHCYASCFFDYMSPEAAAPYLELLIRSSGDPIVRRTEPPVCGTVYLDVASSAQGYWFPSMEPTGSEAYSLYLGPNDFLPSMHSISTGHAIPGLDSFVYTFVPQTSGRINRRFDDIADGEIHCFDTLYDSLESLVQGLPHSRAMSIILQLASDGFSLTIEKRSEASCGTGPWSFSENAVDFYR
ncbi:MAG: hypothetical protein PVJ07_07665 [Anaerolineales bacterium]|jgi:hypothetical protein